MAKVENWNKWFTWLAERVWFTKSQSSFLRPFLNIFFPLSGFQSSLPFIYCCYDSYTCSHCGEEREKLIRYAALLRYRNHAQSPFLSVNGSPIQYGFLGGKCETRNLSRKNRMLSQANEIANKGRTCITLRDKWWFGKRSKLPRWTGEGDIWPIWEWDQNLVSYNGDFKGISPGSTALSLSPVHRSARFVLQFFKGRFAIFRHLLRVPDTDDVKQKNKNHETIPSRFLPEQKTKKSFILRHLCPVHEGLTLFSPTGSLVPGYFWTCLRLPIVNCIL